MSAVTPSDLLPFWLCLNVHLRFLTLSIYLYSCLSVSISVSIRLYLILPFDVFQSAWVSVCLAHTLISIASFACLSVCMFAVTTSVMLPAWLYFFYFYLRFLPSSIHLYSCPSVSTSASNCFILLLLSFSLSLSSSLYRCISVWPIPHYQLLLFALLSTCMIVCLCLSVSSFLSLMNISQDLF